MLGWECAQVSSPSPFLQSECSPRVLPGFIAHEPVPVTGVGPGDLPSTGLGRRAAACRETGGFCRGSRILVVECDLLFSEIIPFI